MPKIKISYEWMRACMHDDDGGGGGGGSGDDSFV